MKLIQLSIAILGLLLANRAQVVAGNKYDPAFPFGFGLSYTTFEYANLRTKSDSYGLKDDIEITVGVKNVGTRMGKEVVQLYSKRFVSQRNASC